MEKIALVFPGIGYHTDKPLLYYSKKLAVKYGYRTIDVSYTGFPSGVKGDAEKMEQCFYLALDQTETLLKEENLIDAKILVLAKSIGTAVAAAYIKNHRLQADFLYYTPVEQTFSFVEKKSGIVFTGTADPWVTTDQVISACDDRNMPLTVIPEANHSLETGEVQNDLEILQQVMEESEAYIKGVSREIER
ncbi:MAG: alpha/beta hydrolase [Lachnospiraceae bacterium]|nr:alpha/beta hydrolase [Lachnospiraceae bacterium]